MKIYVLLQEGTVFSVYTSRSSAERVIKELIKADNEGLTVKEDFQIVIGDLED
jgi:hypothetical protein